MYHLTDRSIGVSAEVGAGVGCWGESAVGGGTPTTKAAADSAGELSSSTEIESSVSVFWLRASNIARRCLSNSSWALKSSLKSGLAANSSGWTANSGDNLYRLD